MKILNSLTILVLLISPIVSLYSKYYKKCKLFTNGKIQVGSLPLERVPEYDAGFNITELTVTTKKVQFEHLDFIYDEYIDAGGSGEVYRVEDQGSRELRVLKRFFKQNMVEFEQENYVMGEMKYEMKWHKQDNNPLKSTMASYPSKQSIVLRDLQLETATQVATVFYKICRELQKAHKKGIIHNDMKMANILIHSVGEGLRIVDPQLIDWNLATYYSKGYDSTEKKGTSCYYSPEAFIRTHHVTPAIDIFALAVVYFTFITEKKPFPVNCKTNNLQAIISMSGSEKFLKVFDKYKKTSGVQMALIEKMRRTKDFYEGISIRDRIPPQFQKIFDNDMIDLLEKMLEIDPEYRLTITQVMHHPYFDKIKKLPKMYVEKNKKKQKVVVNEERHAPANNLVAPEQPDIQGL